MIHEKPGLKFTTKMANRRASRRRKEGGVPLHISLDGLLALMHDKIIRFMKRRDLDEILELAADGLFALEAALATISPEEEETVTEEDFYDDELEEKEPEEESEEELSPEDISELLPDELQNWHSDSDVAIQLKEYLEATNSWGKLNQHFKDLIEEAIDDE